MFEIVLAFTAAILLLSIAALTVVRHRSKAAMLFAFTSLVLAGIEMTDVISLHLTTDPFLFKQITISLESLLPLLFLSLSLTYLREGTKKPAFLPWGCGTTLCAGIGGTCFRLRRANGEFHRTTVRSRWQRLPGRPGCSTPPHRFARKR